jgi:hypothetical protein
VVLLSGVPCVAGPCVEVRRVFCGQGLGVGAK